MARGRILAIDGEWAIVRSERTDARVRADSRWRPGDLIDAETVVRPFRAGEFPAPDTETARLPRVRMTNLQARAKALATLRAFFAERDFIEVETPLLVPSPGLEIHLDAIPAGGGYLITSPEYQMKRLLAGGFERIYQVCKCFRGNERGPHHASEFTMVEWYRAYADLDAIIDDTEQLISRIVPELAPPWPRMTVHDAMSTYANVDVDDLHASVRAAGIEVADDAAWDDTFFAAFLARVEPAIAALPKLILHDWPAPLAALAAKRNNIALRFEAYAHGLELANAFGELTDPVEQRARFEDDQRIRRARGRAVYPIDEKLLAALDEGLPPSAGIALGFDRLVMLATGATDIAGVLTFTADEL